MYQVLLADDELIFLEYMRNIISWESCGCEICAAVRNGEEAERYLSCHRVDIAFLDISMPLRNGLDVCETVRRKNLPVRLVIMTGHDEFSFAYRGIKMGIDDYLLKPFSAGELAEAVRKVTASMEKKAVPAEMNRELLTESATKYEILTREIDQYLQENYGRRALTLSVIAQEIGFDSSYLRRVYKMTTGITIIQKLENIRIAKAKQLLRSGRYQNQEISCMVGFSDPFYFSKRFKQICGVTPSEYCSQEE